MSAPAAYVYALVRPVPAGRENASAEVAGIDGAPVRIVGAGERAVAALVSSVDAGQFGAEAVRRNTGDLRWLEQVARAHDTVISAWAAVTTTLPLRLGTTCADDDAVRSLLADLGGRAEAALARLDGRQEWGVKLLGSPPPGANGPERPSSGAEFLRARRRELHERERALQADEEHADEVFRALHKVSAAARRSVSGARQAEDGRPVLLNSAFLVDAAEAEAFRHEVNSLARRVPGELVLTGPWAPYSFAELDLP